VFSTAPVVLTQPAPQLLSAGGSAFFEVRAEGAQPFSYQWRHEGTNIPAATNSSLTHLLQFEG
jgi:hypothetical protein